jgi:hypothetical protein
MAELGGHPAGPRDIFARMSCRASVLALVLVLPPALTANLGHRGSTASRGDSPQAAKGAIASLALTGPREAMAAVSIQLSLEELTTSTSYVVVATALEQRSQWEELGGSRRIVTYTRLSVERTVAGEPGRELWVRTLGGVVDKIGQQVSGDARLTPGSRSLLFLKKVDTAVVVAGMAQGHYPVVEDEEPSVGAGARRALVRRLAPSPDAGALLPRRGPAISAREQLVGATLDDAVAAVTRAWRATHAQK